MKEDFQIISVDDEYMSGEGVGYTIGLIDVSWKTGRLDCFNFGNKIDGDDYREDCWRADVGFGNSDIVDMISYVSNDGVIHEYSIVDDEFRKKVLNELKIKDRKLYKEIMSL